MKVKNIKIEVEIIDTTQHLLKILDNDTNQILAKGEPCTLQSSPKVAHNNIIFALYEGRIWMEFQSVVNYVNADNTNDSILEQEK